MSIQEKRARQLGMNPSTAVGRLRKMVLFNRIKRVGEDVCYRCGEKITNVKDLSLDHKIPWLDNDTTLFWDLDNIAWSHCNCNSLARRTTKGQTVLRRTKQSSCTSEYMGVRWKKDKQKWEAYDKWIEGHSSQHLGYFDDEEEAAQVAREA